MRSCGLRAGPGKWHLLLRRPLPLSGQRLCPFPQGTCQGPGANLAVPENVCQHATLSTVEDGPLCPSDSGSLDLRFSTAQDQGKCRSKTPGLRAWPVLPLSGVPASLSDSCPEVKGSYRLCSGGRGVTARGREGPSGFGDGSGIVPRETRPGHAVTQRHLSSPNSPACSSWAPGRGRQSQPHTGWPVKSGFPFSPPGLSEREFPTVQTCRKGSIYVQ